MPKKCAWKLRKSNNLCRNDPTNKNFHSEASISKHHNNNLKTTPFLNANRKLVIYLVEYIHACKRP